MTTANVTYGFELEMVIRDKDGKIKSIDTTRLTPEQALSSGLITETQLEELKRQH